jgi:hypothetical protein
MPQAVNSSDVVPTSYNERKPSSLIIRCAICHVDGAYVGQATCRIRVDSVNNNVSNQTKQTPCFPGKNTVFNVLSSSDA